MTEQPPLGLRPRKVVEEDRIIDIFEAIQRYMAARQKIPNEWIEELYELLKKRK